MIRVTGNTFLSENKSHPLIDVRSPSEFLKGHINGAVNIPIFSNQERHDVGTIYKTSGREKAIEKGLAFVGPKMMDLAHAAKSLSSQMGRKVYCWRGGMRSEKMTWLFELLGMECTILDGGYKAYRNFQIEDFKNINQLYILYGSTGSGKTEILFEMEKRGQQVIDLEALANHRGSVFGHLGLGVQPSSQQFQNNIYDRLLTLDTSKPIWMEGESLKIGTANLPDALWVAMKKAKVIEIKIDRQERLKRLIKDYGHYPVEELDQALINLQTYLSKQKIDRARMALKSGNLTISVSIILDYYDQAYDLTRKHYRDRVLFISESKTGNPVKNTVQILKEVDSL